MMKQGLVLSVVLGAAVFANAGFVVTGFPALTDGTFNLAYYADEVIAGVSIRLITDTARPSGTIENVILNDKLALGRKVGDGLVTDGSGVLLSTVGIDGIGGVFDPFDGQMINPGELVFSFDVRVNDPAACFTEHRIEFEQGWYKNPANQILGFDSVVVSLSLIPEPMTMGLLSLGALFLRRRK